MTTLSSDNLCLHCRKAPQIKNGLCEVCIEYPRCSGCEIIFGIGLAKPSEIDPSRCDSCIGLGELMSFECANCHRSLALFYSPKTKVLRYIIRGNFCGRCNAQCAVAARMRKPKKMHEEFLGYLSILLKELQNGKLSSDDFEKAQKANPHDVSRIPANEKRG